MNTRTLALALGGAIIVVANAVALGGVAWNRSGEPESRLALSQRELAKTAEWRAHHEDSGLALSLKWRIPRAGQEAYEKNGYWSYGGSPSWLDERRLAELGFDVERAKAQGAGQQPYLRKSEREVLVVLELAGAAWEQALEGARRNLADKQAALAAEPDAEQAIRAEKQARDWLEREERHNSRLFAIDAGTDLAGLRAQYPDRSRYMILTAHLRLHRSANGDEVVLGGYLNTRAGHRINVPHALRGTFSAARVAEVYEVYEASGAAPFGVVLAVGRRLEPWIESVVQR